MDKKKKTVNVKRFLEDYRSGMTDDELMWAHGLNENSMAKLFTKLKEKNLLDETGAAPTAGKQGAPPPQIPRPAQPAADESTSPDDSPAQVGFIDRRSSNDQTQCPKCGASVSERELTCPECGHALTGADRWEEAEGKVSIVERIPAFGWGIIISIPVAIFLFFFVKDFILEGVMGETDQRIEQLERWKEQGKTPMETARGLVNLAGARSVQQEIGKLISQDVLLHSNEDFSLLTAGPQWEIMSDDDKRIVLTDIRDSMRRADMEVYFEIISESGDSLAEVSGNNVRLGGQEDFLEDSEIVTGPAPTGPPPGAQRPNVDQLQRSIRDQLRRR